MGDSDNGNETDTCTEEQSIEDVDDEADATEDPNSSDVELGWLFVRFFFFFKSSVTNVIQFFIDWRTTKFYNVLRNKRLR